MYEKAKNVEDIKRGLSEIAQNNRSIFTDGWGFKNTQQYLYLLGNPQNKHKTIHIAGTSGKGSTAYYVSTLLIACGFRVGTIVSPHVVDIRERAMINLEYASDSDYVNSFNRIIEMLNDGSISRVSNYETLVLMAFDLFARRDLDYVVVETGLGGLFDTTNTVEREDKVSVITKLGMDHVEILGPTLKDIAKQKAGIMKHGKMSIAIKPGDTDVQKVLLEEANKYENNLDFVEFTEGDKIAGVPDFQAEDMFLAKMAIEKVGLRDHFSLPQDKSILQKTIIPGRFDVRKIDGKTVIFDGAHNAQKIESLVAALTDLGNEKLTWIFAAKDNKDIVKMLQPITTNCQKIIFTSFFQNETNERLKEMPAKPQKLMKLWVAMKNENSVIVDDPIRALQEALKQPYKNPIIVTGSMYMVGEILSSGQFTEQK